jgi:hypothetical protein
MTDRVSERIRAELMPHLDPCDVYEACAKVEQILRPYRDRASAKRFVPPNDDPGLTPEEQRRITQIAGGRKGAIGDRFK